MKPTSLFDRTYLLAGTLVVGVLVLNLTALNNDFLFWDDALYLTENPRVQIGGLAGLATVWSPADAFEGRFVEYFPLRDTLYALLYLGWGLNPLPFHLLQVLLHAGICVLIALWSRSWLGDRAAWAAALLFAVHPVHVESVVWVAALKDPAFTLLVLCSLLAYQRFVAAEGRGARPYWLSVGLLVLALLCKGLALVVPPLLLLLDFTVLKRKLTLKLVLEKVPFGLVAVGFLVLFLSIGSANSVIVEPPGGTAWTGALTMGSVYGVYLGKLLVPLGLSARYVVDPILAIAEPAFVSAMFAALLAWGAALLARIRFGETVPLFAIAWVSICLLPVMNIIPIPIEMADRYLYLPSVGFCVLFGWLVVLVADRLHRPRTAAAVVALVAMCFAGLSSSRNQVWESEETVWLDVLDAAPEFHIGRGNLAGYYMRNGRSADADAQLQIVLRQNPEHVPSMLNRAKLLEESGRGEEALVLLRQALVLDPDRPRAAANLGAVLINLQRYEEAREVLSALLERRPNLPGAHRNLAMCCLSLRDHGCALEHIDRAIELAPRVPAFQADRATVLQYADPARR